MVKGARFKAYAILALVFVLGAAAGAGAAYAYSQRQLESLLSEERGDFDGGRRMQAFARRLGLTDEQREKVRAIHREHRKRERQLLREAMEECGEPLREERAKVDAEIRSVLTKEQRPTFDKLVEKRRERFLLGPPKRGREHGGKWDRRRQRRFERDDDRREPPR